MKDSLQQSPWVILAVGLVVYAFCIINNTNTEIYGGLTLMITLSIWACINIALDSFNITHFIRIFAAAGYLFSAGSAGYDEASPVDPTSVFSSYV